VPGTLSADLHSYAWYGRISAIYGDNPFLYAPAEYADRAPEEWLTLVYWPDVPSVYGPVWVGVAGAIAGVAHSLGDSLTIHILGHKLLAGAAHLANIVLVWYVCGQLIKRYWPMPLSLPGNLTRADWYTSMQVACTLTYAWNPLLLIEFGANGHNDALMLTGVLGALLLHLTGRWRLAVVALALACMVKVAALFFLIPYLLRAPLPNTTGSAVRFQMAGIVLGVWIGGYTPFWRGPEVLEPLWGGPATTLFANSLAAMLRYNGAEWVQPLTSLNTDAVRAVIETPLRWLALLGTLGVGVAWVQRSRSFPALIRGWGWTLFIYLTLGAVWFWPWYVSWLILPATLLGRGRLFNAAQILCFTSMTLYAIYPQLPSYLFDLVYYRSLLIVAPALVYLEVCRCWKCLE
jgi:hypothetical protein